MHPYTQQKLIDTRIAEMRSEAERHQMARMARRARRATQRPAGQRIAGPGFMLGRVLPALLTTHGQRRQPRHGCRAGARGPASVRAGRDAEQHALTKHHSPCKCERSRWLTSSRQHPDLHSNHARKQNIMQNSAAVVFLLALVIVVTGWILSRLSLSPPPGNRAGGLERSKRRR